MASSDAALPGTSGTTNQSENEKHNPTTLHGHRHVSSSSPVPVPEGAPVLGAGGLVGEKSEKAEVDAHSLKQDPTGEPPVYDKDREDAGKEHNTGSEKGTHIIEDGAVVGEGDTSKENTDGEDDDVVVYPGKLQLGLLTLGLCLATFTVALGELYFFRGF